MLLSFRLQFSICRRWWKDRGEQHTWASEPRQVGGTDRAWSGAQISSGVTGVQTHRSHLQRGDQPSDEPISSPAG